jgi:hypothetical protein
MPLSASNESSPRLQLPFRVSPLSHRRCPPSLFLICNRTLPKEQSNPTTNRRSCLIRNLPRFFPLQRFSNHGKPHQMLAHRLLAKFHLQPTRVRPQVFATSRRFAPPVICQAYFIPVPLMGFSPSRHSSLCGAVRSLKRRSLPRVAQPPRRFRRRSRRSVSHGSTSCDRPLFQGLAPQHKSLQSFRGLAENLLW